MGLSRKSPPFYLLLFFAVLLTYIPYISVPFNWLSSFFHELSHGIAALLTGGKILSIQLFPNGAGLCTTLGGNRFLISFMGYTGAILWGWLFYLFSNTSAKRTQLIAATLLVLLTISLMLWVRDLLTFIIVLMLMVIFYIKWKFRFAYNYLVMRVIAVLVLLNAILSPLHLIDGKALGDGASLAALTGIPEIIWVVIWSTLGCIAVIKLGKKS